MAYFAHHQRYMAPNLLHLPPWSGGGSADADALRAAEHGGFYLFGVGYEVAARVDGKTLFEEGFAVGAFLAAD